MNQFGNLVHQHERGLVTLYGDVDAASAVAFHALVDEALSSSPHLVVDVGAVTFMDSTGLRVIGVAVRRAAAAGGSVVVRNTTPEVLRLLELTGFDSVVRIEGAPGHPPPDDEP